MHVGFLSLRIYHLNYREKTNLLSANYTWGIMPNIFTYFILFNPQNHPSEAWITQGPEKLTWQQSPEQKAK